MQTCVIHRTENTQRIATMPEEDHATAIGNVHEELVAFFAIAFWLFLSTLTGEFHSSPAILFSAWGLLLMFYMYIVDHGFKTNCFNLHLPLTVRSHTEDMRTVSF